MPSTSWKQHKFMKRAAADKDFAKEHDIDQKVAQEFVDADEAAGLTTEEDFKKIKKSSESVIDRWIDYFDKSFKQSL